MLQPPAPRHRICAPPPNFAPHQCVPTVPLRFLLKCRARRPGRSAQRKTSNFKALEIIPAFRRACIRIGTPPAIPVVRTVSGILVQAGQSSPLYSRGRSLQPPHPFRGFGTGRPELLLYTGHGIAPAPTLFGDLGTGRPGFPSFIRRAGSHAAASDPLLPPLPTARATAVQQ